MRPLEETSLWAPPMRLSTEDFNDIFSFPPGTNSEGTPRLSRDLEAKAVGPAQGDLCASFPAYPAHTLGTSWREGLESCVVLLVLGDHLLQSPSSPEPQATGLPLPQRQSQTRPHNPSKCGYNGAQSYVGDHGCA